MDHKIVISGFLGYDEDDNNVTIKQIDNNWSDELVDVIASRICEIDNGTQLSKHGECDDEMGGISLYVPSCNLSFYISDNAISLEEVSERYTMQLIGGLDMFGENYGYSSWTILGFSTESFTIGNHDLNEILKSYEDKYINLIIEY